MYFLKVSAQFQLPKVVLLIIFLNCIIVNQAANRQFDFEVSNISCKFYGNIVKNMNCEIRKLSSNLYNMDINFILQRDLHKDTDIRLVIGIKPFENDKKFKFADLKMNLCDLLNAPKLPIMVANSIYKEVMRASNVPFQCPIKGNFLYNVSGFRIDENLFPTYTLLVKYDVTMKFYERGQMYAVVSVKGATLPKSNN
ncbi:uncharacterized protein LOC142239486 [Haematobia irritans]|uniref:uncharacterized protein LOC142239486 n=1 Tax=Haematobia irritans TaxID=7368 RepID=UPI003F5074D6